jgi:asparagine synthase (glutamine-hydrolysing)
VVEPDAVGIAPTLARQYGEPYADSSAIPTFYLAELTRRNVTVALNGDGGDECFAGYLRYVANSLTARIPAAVRRPLATTAALFPQHAGSRSLRARARRLLAPFGLETDARYLRHVSIFSPEERDNVLHPSFRAEVDPSRAFDVIARPWQESTATTPLDALMDIDVRSYLPGDLLVKVDIATMAHSLEARSPFLDPEVMEFAAALPPKDKALWGRKKRILRSAYRGLVPDGILNGPKRGFGVPLAAWLRRDLRDYSREVLLDRSTMESGYTQRSAVESMLDEHQAGDADHSYRIWALMMLELWRRETESLGPNPPLDAHARSPVR